MMCGPSPRIQSVNESTSSQGASPVRTSATPGSEQESKENDQDSGRSSIESFARYDPASCSWRTSQHCFFGGLTEFSETWPRAGSMRSGNAFRHAPLVPRISGTECLLLPAHGERQCSAGAVHLLPTLNQWDGQRGAESRATKQNRGSGGINLVQALKALPTSTSGPLSPTWSEWFMGFPIGWTELRDSETLLSPK